jgi:hypothetical protein
MVREWMYKSSAKKKYKITDNQIAVAIQKGLIEAKEVKNPHHRSSSALLLKVKSVEDHLAEITALPKLSQRGLQQRQRYEQRKKARDKLEFYCPRCEKKIRALKDSSMFEAFFKGEKPLDEARKVLMIAHYRHAHTDYETKLDSLNAERYLKYNKLREQSYEFDYADDDEIDEYDEDDDEDEIDEEQLDKKTFNQKAVELLKKDGLLQT